MLSHRCVQELVEMRIGLGSIQNLRAHHQNERVLPDRCLTDDDLLAARYFHIGGDCDASQNPLELYKYEAYDDDMRRCLLLVCTVLLAACSGRPQRDPSAGRT